MQWRHLVLEPRRASMHGYQHLLVIRISHLASIGVWLYEQIVVHRYVISYAKCVRGEVQISSRSVDPMHSTRLPAYIYFSSLAPQQDALLRGVHSLSPETPNLFLYKCVKQNIRRPCFADIARIVCSSICALKETSLWNGGFHRPWASGFCICAPISGIQSIFFSESGARGPHYFMHISVVP